MKTYTIKLTTPGFPEETLDVPCCERLPQSGDVYQFNEFCYTPRGVYHTGDQLIILDRTGQAPHGRISSLGNLLVKCKYAVSVWTNIEWAIADGRLSLVEDHE